MTELPEWVRQLDMAPHPEGGYFRETWRSDLTIGESVLPPDYNGPRSAGTAILFVLMPEQESAWHTVRSADRSWVSTGRSPAFCTESTNLADTPSRVSCSPRRTSKPTASTATTAP